jgi:hypothetical protein
MLDSTQYDLLCQRIRLENGIDKLIVKRPSRLAADAWLYQIDQIIAQAVDSQLATVRILVDSEVGVLPLGHISAGIRELARKYPRPPKIRYVNLISTPELAGLINSIVRALPLRQLRLRSMSTQQEAEAIAWLLADS